jgi:hypothetical protein
MSMIGKTLGNFEIATIQDGLHMHVIKGLRRALRLCIELLFWLRLCRARQFVAVFQWLL